jgi:sugar lactone lactonase YvrE
MTNALSNAEVLCDARCQVGESPLWSAAVDIDPVQGLLGRALHRVDGQGLHRQWAVPERIGCVALRSGGGLLAAMETGLFALRMGEDGHAACEPVAQARFPHPNMRFNDGRTDRQGRFWVSSMEWGPQAGRPSGSLHRYAAGAGLQAGGVDGLVTGNGLGFSPDGRTMYLSDSHASVQLVWAFDVAEDATLHRRRVFIDMNLYPGRPDGAAVDADGCYWICANDAGLVHRFTPTGRLDRSLAVPAAKPSMCAFGGACLDRLYVTTIRPPTPLPGVDAMLAGATFVLDPGCTGLAEASC